LHATYFKCSSTSNYHPPLAAATTTANHNHNNHHHTTTLIFGNKMEIPFTPSDPVPLSRQTKARMVKSRGNNIQQQISISTAKYCCSLITDLVYIPLSIVNNVTGKSETTKSPFYLYSASQTFAQDINSINIRHISSFN
jgi:hypothetical protein